MGIKPTEKLSDERHDVSEKTIYSLSNQIIEVEDAGRAFKNKQFQ
jgi:hypothetical protein